VQINYKSGISTTAWFKDFKIKHREGRITELEWDCVAGSQKVLHIGVNDIESIWQLEVKEIYE
jgi:hypothetical protein